MSTKRGTYGISIRTRTDPLRRIARRNDVPDKHPNLQEYNNYYVTHVSENAAPLSGGECNTQPNLIRDSAPEGLSSDVRRLLLEYTSDVRRTVGTLFTTTQGVSTRRQTLEHFCDIPYGDSEQVPRLEKTVGIGRTS